MKFSRFILILSILAFAANVFGQKDKKAMPTNPSTPTPPVATKGNPAAEMEKSIYKRALRYGDAAQAKDALYHLIEIDSAGANYKDSLLALYFGAQSYVSATLLGREILVGSPKDSRTLGVVAASEQSLGLFTEALDHYKTLYSIAKDPNDLYQMATIEYRLERLGECKQHLLEVIQNPNSEKGEVYLAYNEKEGQNVPIRAAAYNILGFIERKDRPEDAKKLFEKALELEPKFLLAKNNLEQMDKKPEEKK
jgi:tetratricopeptide (TPR) repeat protein